MASYLIKLIMVTESDSTSLTQQFSDRQVATNDRLIRLTFAKRIRGSRMRVGIPWLLVIVKVLNLTNLLVQLVHADIKELVILERCNVCPQSYVCSRFQYVD